MVKRPKKNTLLQKSSRNYLLTGLILMLLSMIGLYAVAQYLIREETDDSLRSTLFRVESQLEKGQNPGSLHPLMEITETDTPREAGLKDTLLLDPMENEMEMFRELTSYRQISGTNYRIAIRTLVVDTEDVVIAIMLAYITILVLLYLAQFYFIKRHNQRIWKPFFENIERMKGFSIKAGQPPPLVESDILEFSELNRELEKLMEKVITDYKNLKQFTEDVSHEIQTPLAIIQAKIGNIVDDHSVSTGQFKLLTEVQQNIQRLANLNKKLVLLAKIDNRQFSASENINMLECLTVAASKFQEISGTSVEVVSQGSLEVFMDRTLAQTLIDNLLSNALKHSPEKSSIRAVLTNSSITVINPGEHPIANPERLFERFYREDTTNKSLGLGLAIVKKICDANEIEIEYFFKEGEHNFSLTFLSI